MVLKMKLDDRLKEFERKYNKKIKENKPIFCQTVVKSEKGLDAVSTFEIGRDEITIVYDCYCKKCEWSGEISPDNLANIEFEPENEDICCVCKHPLPAHIDEGDEWRCHYLGPDVFNASVFSEKTVPIEI